MKKSKSILANTMVVGALVMQVTFSNATMRWHVDGFFITQ